MSDSIRIEGLEKLLAKVKSLGELKPVKAKIKLAGAHLAGKLKQYPPVRRGPQPFKTQKQRRFFFYAIDAGKIQVPYQRGQSPGSRNLKQSWTVDTYNSGFTAQVGTNAPYARLVQSAPDQAHYHQVTGW